MHATLKEPTTMTPAYRITRHPETRKPGQIALRLENGDEGWLPSAYAVGSLSAVADGVFAGHFAKWECAHSLEAWVSAFMGPSDLGHRVKSVDAAYAAINDAAARRAAWAKSAAVQPWRHGRR